MAESNPSNPFNFFDRPLVAGAEVEVQNIMGVAESSPVVSRFFTPDAYPDNRHIVLWQTDENGTSDIYGRVYAADGSAGAEFLVAGNASIDETDPSIIALADGGIVVTWMQDTGLFWQRYSANGDPLQPNGTPGTGPYQTAAGTIAAGDAAALADGGFVAVWTTGDGDIYARIHEASGSTTGQLTVGAGANASVAALADGGYVVVWEGTDTQGSGIVAQVFDDQGVPGAALSVNNMTTAGDQLHPTVTAMPDGGFVVTWNSEAGDFDTVARRYDADFNPVGDEFGIPVADAMGEPVVTALSDGGFVVITETVDGDGSAGIVGVRYDADGNMVDLNGQATTEPFQIVTDPTGDETNPAVTAMPNGGFVVTWESDGGVQSRAFQPSAEPVLVSDGATSVELPVSVVLADGESEGLTMIQLQGLPEGASMDLGQALGTTSWYIWAGNSPEEAQFLADLADGTATLELNLPAGWDGTQFGMSVLARSQEGGDVNAPFRQVFLNLAVAQDPSTHAPTLDTDGIEDATATVGSPFTFTVSDDFVEVDAGDTLAYTATLAGGGALPSWLTIDANTGVLSGTPATGDDGTISIIVTATDDGGAAVSDTFTLTVDAAGGGEPPVNTPPRVGTGVDNTAAMATRAFSFTIPSGAFVDADGDRLTLTATFADGSPLPAWLKFDPRTGTFAGTPEKAGTLAVRVTATDPSGATVFDNFRLTVTAANPNDEPPVAQSIDDQTAYLLESFAFAAGSHFNDPDGGRLTFAATLAGGAPLPDWLTFDAATGTISGMPERDDIGDLAITVTATDPGGSAVSTTFDLAIVGDITPGNGGKGGSGGDDLAGRNGDDRLFGGAGNDTLVGANGDDALFGGAGRDDLAGGAGDDVLAGGAGRDGLDGGGGADELVGGGGGDILGGSGGDDTLGGGDGGDGLDGGAGRDDLAGNRGDDTLEGGDGRDVLEGGAGHDRLAGGAGADVFVFGSTAAIGTGAGQRDVILDFEAGDRIDLSAVDAVRGEPGDQAFRLVDLADFGASPRAGQIAVDAASGRTLVLGDTDGDGTADFVLELTGLHDLAARDFVL